MKLTRASIILAAFTLSLVCVASAATDPWVGTWFKKGKNMAPDKTLIVKTTPSGYTFEEKNSDVNFSIAVPIIPDGKPHTIKYQGADVTSLCNHDGARAFACKLTLAGMLRKVRYTLSADGQTLSNTESDPEASMQVSTQSNVSANSNGATDQSAASAATTGAGEYTHTTVYHRK